MKGMMNVKMLDCHSIISQDQRYDDRLIFHYCKENVLRQTPLDHSDIV